MSLRWHFDEFNARCITGWIDDEGDFKIEHVEREDD